MSRKRPLDPVQRAFIDSIKHDPSFSGFVTREGDDVHRVSFLGRGETAFYQHGERALLLEVIAGRGIVFEESIRRWDTGEKVTPEERGQVIAKVSDALRQLGAGEVRVVGRDGK